MSPLQTWPAGPGPSKADPDVKVRVLEASYGDGYTQTSGDGLNTIVRSYSITWELLNASELAVYETFLEAHGGHIPFLWTPPRAAAARQWKCRNWKPQPLSGGWSSLQATFTESFDL